MATVQSIERAIHLLVEIGRTPGGLVELAERAELPISTTARILSTLEGVDAVSRSGDGIYEIGSAIHALAPAPQSDSFRQAYAALDQALGRTYDAAACARLARAAINTK